MLLGGEYNKMGKFWDFVNHLGSLHKKRIERNIKMDEFLDSQHDNALKITEIGSDMKYLRTTVDNIETKVNSLESDINHINGRLEIIGSGTKMELFDTLHHWEQLLLQRGWATAAEKHEVEEIYKIYHDGLGGNGQGERYYRQIMDLPEKEADSNN